MCQHDLRRDRANLQRQRHVGSLASGRHPGLVGLAFTTDPASITGEGSYGIVPALSNAANYDVTYVDCTLTVNAALALTASGTSLPAATVGNSYASNVLSTYVSASGGSGSGYTYTITSGLPNDFSVNGSNEIASNTTPAAGDAGSYTLTFKVTDSANNTATCSITLTVNSAPVITSNNSATFTYGTGGTFTITTTGYPAPTITETATLPSGVTFQNNGNGTATLSVAATAAGGAYSLSFTAANSVSPNATQSFTLTVDAAPVITSANGTNFTVGVGGTFTITTTGYPTPTITETGSLPSGVTFTNNGNGTATLSVSAGAADDNTSFTITAANGIGSNATQTFTLNPVAPTFIGGSPILRNF